MPGRKITEISHLTLPFASSKGSSNQRLFNASKNSKGHHTKSPEGTSKQSNNSSVCIHGALELEGRLEKRYENTQGRVGDAVVARLEEKAVDEGIDLEIVK